MITLKIGNYNKDEKYALYEALSETKMCLCNTLCWEDDCPTCPQKRVCDDIQSALDYLVQDMNKKSK